MFVRKLLLGTSLVSYGLISGWAGSPSLDSESVDHGQPDAELALIQLQSDFHEAITRGDYELMLSLWAEDAVFSSPAATVVGRTAIANFFSSGWGWGATTNLTSSYKAGFDIRGNKAAFEFECIAVDVGGMDPETTPLSTIPFGAQNPAVKIVQHSHASCTAVKRGRHCKGGRQWVIQTFMGSAGPIVP